MSDVDLERIQKELDAKKKQLDQIQTKMGELMRTNFITSLWKNVKQDEIKSFVKKPYFIKSEKEDEWLLMVPKMIPLEVGWFEYPTESYNVFRINRFVDYMTPLPDILKEELGMEKPEFELSFNLEKSLLEIQKGEMKNVKKKYGSFINRQVNQSTLSIRSNQKFSFLLELLKDGYLPYENQHANKDDFIKEESPIKLRDYQEDAWKKFMQYSHVAIFYPFGAGKTEFGLYAASKIKGRKLIVTGGTTLVEMWKKRIQEKIPEQYENCDIITFKSLDKYANKHYDLVIADEVHHAPADTYSQVFFIPRKYTIGLTGTPMREDGRTELIFSFGYPIGLDWNYFFKRGIVKKPTATVILVSKLEDKYKELQRLMEKKSVSLIYCDKLEHGKEISKKFKLDFIFSKTKKRLEAINDSLEKNGAVVVSRVGDEGMDLPEIQRVIEFSFLFGSRRQEAQRIGRLFHAFAEGEHFVLMTYEEYQKYQKRLYSLYEHGIEITWVKR